MPSYTSDLIDTRYGPFVYRVPGIFEAILLIYGIGLSRIDPVCVLSGKFGEELGPIDGTGPGSSPPIARLLDPCCAVGSSSNRAGFEWRVPRRRCHVSPFWGQRRLNFCIYNHAICSLRTAKMLSKVSREGSSVASPEKHFPSGQRRYAAASGLKAEGAVTLCCSGWSPTTPA